MYKVTVYLEDMILTATSEYGSFQTTDEADAAIAALKAAGLNATFEVCS